MNSLDLDRAAEKFAESTDFTVGVEEEFSILAPETLDLVPRFEQLRDAAASDRLLHEHITGELITSEIEIISGVGADLHDALARQRERRRRLFGLAAANGAALGATGTHPWADYREQPIIDTEHYRRVEQGLKYVAWRNNTFSLHVHVGIRGADRAIAVCNRLRPILPELLAVPTHAAQGLANELVEAGVKIIFNYSESLLDVPPEVTVHTSSPAVDLLYALYFYLT